MLVSVATYTKLSVRLCSCLLWNLGTSAGECVKGTPARALCHDFGGTCEEEEEEAETEERGRRVATRESHANEKRIIEVSALREVMQDL